MEKMDNRAGGIPPRRNKWWHTPLFMAMYGLLYMVLTPYKLYVLWKMHEGRRNHPFPLRPFGKNNTPQ